MFAISFWVSVAGAENVVVRGGCEAMNFSSICDDTWVYLVLHRSRCPEQAQSPLTAAHALLLLFGLANPRDTTWASA